jgi:hypothetical protein
MNEALGNSRMKLKTHCEKWMDSNLYWENETADNQDEMSKKLLEGQEDFFKALQRT